jgi:exonuclease III
LSASLPRSEPDQGDQQRLWNLEAMIPAFQHFSRIFRGNGELIDHILVSHHLVNPLPAVRAVQDRPLASITEDPGERRNARDSDHAPLAATFKI